MIATEKGQPERRKLAELESLKIGESLTVNVEGLRKNCHVGFYIKAKRIGIRVGVKRIDEKTVRVTRIG